MAVVGRDGAKAFKRERRFEGGGVGGCSGAEGGSLKTRARLGGPESSGGIREGVGRDLA